MNYLFLLFLSVSVLAREKAPSEPQHWGAAIEIVDKHEFYEEGKEITTPAETWQTLFSVTYVSRNLVKVKDCVIYRIPGKDVPGTLKIKSLPLAQDCSKVYFEPGDKEVQSIKSLEFSSSTEGIVLSFSQPNYASGKWDISLSHPKINEPKLMMSSAEYKAGKIILLSSGQKEFPASKALEGKCHDIDDQCQEVSPSKCSLCPEGWYEIPNGCPTGPKFCGIDQCGEKNQPACRKGMRYQREDKKFECRIDSSFAYCNPGLLIQCEGSLAYCR